MQATEQQKAVNFDEANPQNDFEKLLTKDHTRDVAYDDNAYARTMRLADLMAGSGQAVPKHCRNNKGMCFSLILQCHAWGIKNYFAAVWETYVEPKADRLCYMAKLVMAAAKLSGAIQGGFEFEYKDGADIECRSGALVNGNMVWGEWRKISSVKVKNSPLWFDDPKQQFAYSRALSWIRLKYPEIIMGIYIADELESAGDIGSKPMADVDLSTSLDEVNAIIAEINATTTPAEQKLIRARAETVIGDHRSKVLAAYSGRTKYFKAQAKQAEEAQKQAETEPAETSKEKR